MLGVSYIYIRLNTSLEEGDIFSRRSLYNTEEQQTREIEGETWSEYRSHFSVKSTKSVQCSPTCTCYLFMFSCQTFNDIKISLYNYNTCNPIHIAPGHSSYLVFAGFNLNWSCTAYPRLIFPLPTIRQPGVWLTWLLLDCQGNLTQTVWYLWASQVLCDRPPPTQQYAPQLFQNRSSNSDKLKNLFVKRKIITRVIGNLWQSNERDLKVLTCQLSLGLLFISIFAASLFHPRQVLLWPFADLSPSSTFSRGYLITVTLLWHLRELQLSETVLTHLSSIFQQLWLVSMKHSCSQHNESDAASVILETGFFNWIFIYQMSVNKPQKSS